MDRNPDDVAEARPGRLKHPFDVVDDHLGLFLDRRADDRARGRVDRPGTGDKNEVAGAPPLRIGSQRGERLARFE